MLLLLSEKCSDTLQVLGRYYIVGDPRPLNFRNFYKMRGGSDFYHKNGRVCNIWGKLFLKGVYHLYSYYLSLFSVIFLNIWCCVFCVFAPFPSVLFVFHANNVLLLNLHNRYMTSASE